MGTVPVAALSVLHGMSFMWLPVVIFHLAVAVVLKTMYIVGKYYYVLRMKSPYERQAPVARLRETPLPNAMMMIQIQIHIQIQIQKTRNAQVDAVLVQCPSLTLRGLMKNQDGMLLSERT